MELTPKRNAAGPAAGSCRPLPCSDSPRPSLKQNKDEGSAELRAASGGTSPASPAAFLLTFLLFLLFAAGAAMACPSCKEGLSSSENPAASAKLTRGWAQSIYLLMWMPYVIFGGVAFGIVRSARRSKK